MKSFSQNRTIILQSNKRNCKFCNNKVVLKILILFFLMIYGNSIAQTSNNIPKVKEVNSFLSTLKSTSISEYERLDGLIHNVNPAIYNYDNTLNVYGKNCTVLFTDIPSINYIKNNSIPSNRVELLQINIRKSSDLNRKIDLSIFENFPNLKYIYVFSETATSENYINQMFINYDSKYSLLYKINLGE